MKLVLSGWHGHDNAGDDATLLSFVSELVAPRDRELTVLCEVPERVEALCGSDLVRARYHYETLGLHGLTHLFKGRLGQHLALLREAEGFFLGGGSLLRDNTTWHNLFRVVDEIFWAKRFGKKVALYAGGIGPIETSLGRAVIGRALRRCDLITVRDENSARLARELGAEEHRIHVVADPGFLLQPREVDDPELLARVRRPNCVGFFPSLGFIDDGKDLSEIPRIARGLDQLAEQRSCKFLAMPMRVLANEIDDIHVAQLIRSHMQRPEALEICERQFDASQLRWLTSQFPLNLTIRLHALIFSLASAVPTVGIEYEPKVTNLLRDFELPDFGVPMGERLSDSLVERVGRALEGADAFRQHATERIPVLTASARRTFERFEELLAGTTPAGSDGSQAPRAEQVVPPSLTTPEDKERQGA